MKSDVYAFLVGYFPANLSFNTAGKAFRSSMSLNRQSILTTDSSVSPTIFNEDDILFHNFNELYLTRDLTERKQLMLDISDSFVAVPGGVGTIDELFEVYAQSHLGYYRKPLILFNINGYYDKLWQFICEAHEEGFISDRGMSHCRIADSAEEVISLLKDEKIGW